MPGCVLDESMEPSKVMPGSSVIVEEEEALVRPKEPTLHTCWTWRLIDSCHCLLSSWGPEEQVCQERKLTWEPKQTMAEPASFTYFYKGSNSVN